MAGSSASVSQAYRADVVVVGGSAGSIPPLERILLGLPRDYALSVCVVLHQHRHGGLHLPDLLSRRCALPVVGASDKDPIEPGRVYTCPANYQLLFESRRTFALSADEVVNFARPSIDVTFESASRVYRDRVVGVLLSGTSGDGARGLLAIHAAGGHVICQDPRTASEPTMPRAGIGAVPVAEIASPEVLAMIISRFQR